jgi:fumarate reductase subunit D
MNTPLKRSNAPIFWALFGAGGMLSALFGAALVFITGIGAPLGIGISANALSYANVHALATNFVGKGFLLAVVALFLWHAGHRIFHSLHDIGIHAGTGAKLVCYGLPLLGTLAASYCLLRIGF